MVNLFRKKVVVDECPGYPGRGLYGQCLMWPGCSCKTDIEAMEDYADEIRRYGELKRLIYGFGGA